MCACVLCSHGPSVSDAHLEITRLQNERQILSRQVSECTSRLRASEEQHAGEILLARSDNLALRNQIAALSSQLAEAREGEKSKAEEVAMLQQTLLQVSADYDRMAGASEDEVAARAVPHNLSTSSYVADSLERARLLAEKQAQLRDAEERRAAQLAKEDALNQALLAEGGAAHSGNLAAVVTSLQESRQLLRLYQVEYARQECIDEATAAERYLLDHEAVAVKFIRLRDRVHAHRCKQSMQLWRNFLAVQKRGRDLAARRAQTALERTMRAWMDEMALRKRGASCRALLLTKLSLRTWRAQVVASREEAVREALRTRQRQALQVWAAQSRHHKLLRRFRARQVRARLGKWFDAWRARQAQVVQAQENGALLASAVRTRTMQAVLASWKHGLYAHKSRKLMADRKLQRHMLAWFAVSRARKSQQLSLLSLRHSCTTRRTRSLFHAWFLAMQRQRLRALSDTNTLLAHDLGVMSAKLKTLAHENTTIAASLTERLYSAADEKERQVEYEKKEQAYEANFKNEMALREKLKHYEQRSETQNTRTACDARDVRPDRVEANSGSVSSVLFSRFAQRVRPVPIHS